MSAEHFAGRLKELREAAGLSQRELAEKAGISVRQVSRLETSSQVATWPTVLALAKVLGVNCTAFDDKPAEPSGVRPKGRPKKKGGA